MSIESVKLALERKNMPLKNYTVRFIESDYYTIDVVARDKEEAKDKAWNEHNNGNYSGGNGDTEIDEVEEGNLVEVEDQQ